MTPLDAEKTSTKDSFESELHCSNEGLTLETSAFLPFTLPADILPTM